MSFFDFAGATKIVQLLESSTPADGTVEPSYTAGVCSAAFSKIVGGTPGAGEVADNAYYFCRIDLSKTQNAVGVQVVTSLTGVETCSLGITAILFPQDTTDADEPQFKV